MAEKSLEKVLEEYKAWLLKKNISEQDAQKLINVLKTQGESEAREFIKYSKLGKK